MFYPFLTVVLVSLLIMLILFVNVIKKRDSVSKILAILLVFSTLTILFYLINIITTDYKTAQISICLYFIFLDLALVSLLIFTLTISDANIKVLVPPALKYFFISLLFFDFALLITNIFIPYYFNAIQRISPITKTAFWDLELKFPFLFHLAVSYILMFFIIGRLLYKSIKSPSFFRKKYALALLGFITISISHIAYTQLKWVYDYSVIGYSIMAFISWYFSFISIPSNIISVILNKSADSNDNALAFYNNFNEEIFINKKAEKLFAENKGFRKELTQLHEKWLENVKNQDDEYLKQTKIFESLNENIIFSVEHKIFRDKRNRIIGSYIKLVERTDEINKLNEERYKAAHDELTGLLNRSNFFETVSAEIDENPDGNYYMVATDIKNFKLVNDLFGTRFGDDVLKLEAKIIKKHGYLSGRISSDKFAIFLNKKDNTHKELMKIIEEVQSITKNLNYKLLLYMGVYEIANPYENVQSMYDKANLAIKKIYGTYENNISYYDTSLMESLIHQKSIIRDFNKGRNKNEIEMYLQPQFDAKTENCLGAEALIRWNNSKRGHLSPDKFVHILETGDYIYNMDHLIWEKAAETLRHWKDIGFNKYISVNISGRDFYYEDIFQVFKGLVEKYQFSPSQMNLEITETALMHDTQSTRKVLENLKEYGFKIEMDDFGSGYSSLNNLKNMNMDVLKIDMEFLGKTENTARSHKILAALIKMAKSLGMTVITEGVEHKEQAEMLKNLGSDIFQGYFYSKPVTLNEFERTYMVEK